MLIGVPKEIKSQEYRVGLTPASVRELTAHRQHAGRRAANIDLCPEQRYPALCAGAGRSRLQVGARGPSPLARRRLNVCQGKVTCREVAEALHYPYHDPLRVLAA